MTHGGSAIVVSTRDRRRGIDGQHRCLERQIIYRCVRRLAAANLAARITTFVTSAMTVCRSGDDAPTTGSRPSVVSPFRQSTSRNGPLVRFPSVEVMPPIANRGTDALTVPGPVAFVPYRRRSTPSCADAVVDGCAGLGNRSGDPIVYITDIRVELDAAEPATRSTPCTMRSSG